MAEARITEFFGETQTDGRSVRISGGSLGFHGIGVVHAKGSLEVALPPTSSLSVVDGGLVPVPWEDLDPAMVQEIQRESSGYTLDVLKNQLRP